MSYAIFVGILFVEIWLNIFFLYFLISQITLIFKVFFNQKLKMSSINEQKKKKGRTINISLNKRCVPSYIKLVQLFSFQNKYDISFWKFQIIDPINEKENRRINIHYLNYNVSSHRSRRKINYTFWNDILRKSINKPAIFTGL